MLQCGGGGYRGSGFPASGWLPQTRDLSVWRELRQITTAGTGFKVNCYLIWDEVTREAALFDTGFEAQPIFDQIAEHKLYPAVIAKLGAEISR